MEHDVMPVIETAREWYEQRRNKNGSMNRNVMAVGIAVSHLLRTYFPLDEKAIKTDGKSQVRGLSGKLIESVLREHGETRPFASEGGRTSRGSLDHALVLGAALTKVIGPTCPSSEERAEIAEVLESYFVSCIEVDFYSKQRIKVDIDSAKPVSCFVRSVLDAAELRDDKPTGTVAQHLVGAKLELRFPEKEIGRDNANAADVQTNRSGDFQIGTTAFHVTVSPMAKLVGRCIENIHDGLRPYVVVPDDKVGFTRGLFESEGIGTQVQVQGIETFVGTNIEELAQFDGAAVRKELISLVRQYNARIEDIEPDQSLQILEPKWMEKLAVDGY